MFSEFFHIGGIIAPIFLTVAAGYGLVRFKIVRPEVSDGLAKVAFYLGLPVLLFLSLCETDLRTAASWRQPITVNVLLLIFVVLTLWIARLLRLGPDRKGVFSQASFRSNMAYMGLPLCMNAFGTGEFHNAVLLLAYLIPMYNILAVVVLTLTRCKTLCWDNIRPATMSVAKNPLIIAVAVGIVFSLLQIRLHPVLLKTLKPIGDASLPISLISVGCSLRLSRAFTGSRLLLWVSFLKLIVCPAFFYAVLVFLGFPRAFVQAGVIMLATPTAIASYIMAREMGGDEEFAAKAVMFTTLASAITLAAWLAIVM